MEGLRLSENLCQLARLFKEGGREWPTGKHRVDHLECLVNLLSHLGASQHNLAANEDQQYDLGLHHAIDETRKEFGLVRAEVVMSAGEAFEADGKLDVARADDVLDLEVRELGVEPKLLNDPSVLARGKL